MRVVHRVETLRPGCFEISLVRRGRIGIAARGRLVITDPFVDVRGHVHQMTGHWHQLWQLWRVRQRALRMRRSFDGVNVIVNRAGMIRVAP